MSLSSRRAWIEIVIQTVDLLIMKCRSPHGERGLKSTDRQILNDKCSRSPHGERGLKYLLTNGINKL